MTIDMNNLVDTLDDYSCPSPKSYNWEGEGSRREDLFVFQSSDSNKLIIIVLKRTSSRK